MKRLTFVTVLLLSVSTRIWAQLDTLPDGLGATISTPEGLREVIERKDPRFVIIDVRPFADYASGHIPTAISIPGGLTAELKDPPAKDKYVVLYCLGGMRSPAAGDKMQADGYQYVYVWGGIMKWPYPQRTLTK